MIANKNIRHRPKKKIGKVSKILEEEFPSYIQIIMWEKGNITTEINNINKLVIKIINLVSTNHELENST